jgi:hypothetical protein
VRITQFIGSTRLSRAVVGFGDVHHRRRIVIEAFITCIADDANDLARPFFEFGAEAVARRDARAEFISLRPIFFGHRFVDDDHVIGNHLVALVEFAAAEERDAKHAEILRRNIAPLNVAVEIAVRWGHAFDRERQINASVHGQAACEADRFDAGNRANATLDFLRGRRHRRSLRKAIAGERHLHGENVVRVEAGLYFAKAQVSPDQQRGADQKHQGESHFRDDEDRARFVLAEAAAGAGTSLFECRREIRLRGAERGD